MTVRNILCTALVATALTATAAAASLFDLRYVAQGGDILTATIDGALNGDGNTLVVRAVIDPMFNGATGAAIPFVDSALPRGFSPVLTLDGSIVNLIAFGSGDGFSFGSVSGTITYRSDPFYGSISEAFNSANYSLTAATPIPLPAPAALLIAGLAGLGLVRRRRRA